jgi:hypothetical protein
MKDLDGVRNFAVNLHAMIGTLYNNAFPSHRFSDLSELRLIIMGIRRTDDKETSMPGLSDLRSELLVPQQGSKPYTSGLIELGMCTYQMSQSQCAYGLSNEGNLIVASPVQGHAWHLRLCIGFFRSLKGTENSRPSHRRILPSKDLLRGKGADDPGSTARAYGTCNPNQEKEYPRAGSLPVARKRCSEQAYPRIQ